jgi:hypothetical protein
MGHGIPLLSLVFPHSIPPPGGFEKTFFDGRAGRPPIFARAGKNFLASRPKMDYNVVCCSETLYSNFIRGIS